MLLELDGINKKKPLCHLIDCGIIGYILSVWTMAARL